MKIVTEVVNGVVRAIEHVPQTEAEPIPEGMTVVITVVMTLGTTDVMIDVMTGETMIAVMTGEPMIVVITEEMIVVITTVVMIEEMTVIEELRVDRLVVVDGIE